MASSNPWAWLGLMKWSLAYADGTAPSTAAPLSEEHKEFRERVMKEGIIDENERMKTILEEVTAMMEKWKSEAATDEEADQVEDLLQELRDIVEQIDYARAFAAMKGLDFLLGCVQERSHMPKSTRLMCLGILATMCQHNPPVQKELLEQGSLRILSDLFFDEADEDADGKLRARTIQAMSANVRSHELAESVFCQLQQAPQLMEMGLGVRASTKPPTVLRQRTLFFLRALIASDSSTRERIQLFTTSIVWTLDHMLNDQTEESVELREMALAMTEQLLEQKKSVNGILSRKDKIASTGIRRVTALRTLTGEEREFAATELELWERILILLARATPDPVEESSSEPTRLLEADKQSPVQ